MPELLPRRRLDQPRRPRTLRFEVDPEAFARFSERLARFLGTGKFLFWQTVMVLTWITLNLAAVSLRWDPYPFILLNLAFSTQAAYAAPLILLAQNRQDDRDRVALDEDQKDVLSHLDDERAADILEVMDPDDAADLLAELSEMDKDRLLALMEPAESAPVRRLLEYPHNSAGGLMTPEPIVLPPDATIAEALAHVRNPDLIPALASMVFVCRPPTDTPTGRYLGCAHTQRLLREPPFTLVASALDTELVPLRPDDTLTQVTKYFAAYNLVCAPVIDDENHLLGAVTVDDILDHLLPEGWRETQEAADA